MPVNRNYTFCVATYDQYLNEWSLMSYPSEILSVELSKVIGVEIYWHY